GSESFSYDGSHRAASDSFGLLANQWAYGSSGALATQTWGSGSSPSLSRVSPASVQGLSTPVRLPVTAASTDALTHTTAWQLDSRGRLLTQADPNGGVTTYAHDPSTTFVTAVTDPLANTTAYARDAAGYVTAQTDPNS